jgi:hypothetical protein
MKETGGVYQQASPGRRINGISIQGEEVTVTVEKPTEKMLEFTTEDSTGKVMYLIVVENENKPTTQGEMVSAALEHGWKNLSQSTVSLVANKLVGQGILVAEGSPVKYRVPSKLKVKAEK